MYKSVIVEKYPVLFLVCIRTALALEGRYQERGC